MEPTVELIRPLILRWAFLLLISGAFTIFLVVPLFLGRFQESGLIPDDHTPRRFLAGLGWGFGGVLFLVLVGLVTRETSLILGASWKDIYPGLEIGSGTNLGNSLVLIGPLWAVGLFIAEQSLFEELLFRTILFAVPAMGTIRLGELFLRLVGGEGLRPALWAASWGFWGVASSLLFSAVHLGNPGARSEPLFLANVFLIALALALAYRTFGGIYFPAGFHFAWNLAHVLLGMRLSGFPSGLPWHPVAVVVGEPKLISLSPMGLEGGMGASMVGLGMIAWLVWQRKLGRHVGN